MQRSMRSGAASAVLGTAVLASADEVEVHAYDVPSIDLAIFGLQYTADFLGPATGWLSATRVNLTFVADGPLDAADIRLFFQAPSNGVPGWTLTGADLGWSGSGTFNASLETASLDGPIDVGGDFSLFFLRLDAVGGQPMSGHFEMSAFEVDVAPLVRGDANGDCLVDVDDLVAVILHWGPCGLEMACPADVNGDGAVDVDDLVEVILAWS